MVDVSSEFKPPILPQIDTKPVSPKSLSNGEVNLKESNNLEDILNKLQPYKAEFDDKYKDSNPREVLSVIAETNEITLPIESNKELTNDEIEKLLQDEQVLQDTAYMFLTSDDFSPESIRQRLQSLLKNRLNGVKDEEQEKIIQKLKDEHEEKYRMWRQKKLQGQHRSFERDGKLASETEPVEDLWVTHITDYPPGVDEEGNISIGTTFTGTGILRTSVHTTLNHPVAPAAVSGMGEFNWFGKKMVILSPYQGVTELNGDPYGMIPEDTFWGVGATGKLKLPEKTIIIAGSQVTSEELEQYEHAHGVEVIQVDSNKPYHETRRIMEEHGIKYIHPTEFRSPEKFADDHELFYGTHYALGNDLPSLYPKAEGLLSNAIGYDSNIIKNELAKFNSSSDSSERFYILTELLQDGYFARGFPDIQHKPVRKERGFPDNFGEYDIDETWYKDLGEYDWKSSYPEDEPLRQRLVAMSDNLELQLVPNKEAELYIGRNRILNNIDRIPPNLLGAFILENKDLIQ